MKRTIIFSLIAVLIFFGLGLEDVKSETTYPGYITNNSKSPIIVRLYQNIEEGKKIQTSSYIYSIPLEMGESYPVQLPLGEFTIMVFNSNLNVWRAKNFVFKENQTKTEFILQYTE